MVKGDAAWKGEALRWMAPSGHAAFAKSFHWLRRGMRKHTSQTLILRP